MPRARRIRDDVGDDEPPRAKRSVVRGEDIEVFRNLPLDIREDIVARASGTWTSEEVSAMVACEPVMARVLAPVAILKGLEKGVTGTFWRSTLMHMHCCGEGSDDDRRLEQAFLHAACCLRLRSWAREEVEKRGVRVMASDTNQSNAIRRICGEVLRAQTLDNVVSWPEENLMAIYCVVFVKVEDDDEEGKKPRVGTVHFRYKVSGEYPFRPPKVTVKKWRPGSGAGRAAEGARAAHEAGEMNDEIDEWLPFNTSAFDAQWWSPGYTLTNLIPFILAHTLPELRALGCVYTGENPVPVATLRAALAAPPQQQPAQPSAAAAFVVQRVSAKRIRRSLSYHRLDGCADAPRGHDEFFIRTITGKTIVFDERVRTTVDDLRRWYASKEGPPPNYIDFIVDNYALLTDDMWATFMNATATTMPPRWATAMFKVTLLGVRNPAEHHFWTRNS